MEIFCGDFLVSSKVIDSFTSTIRFSSLPSVRFLNLKFD
jgi:hypothetical protein